MAQQKCILIILDGWGINPDPRVSAIARAETPCMDALMEQYPSSRLHTHGIYVGLPEGQMGNSEVGHMNIGAGHVIYQDLLRINLEIEDGAFGHNEILVNALEYAKAEQKAVHVLGIASDGGVHGHIDHMKAVADVAAGHGLEDVYFHAFTDGRDTDPKSGIRFLNELQQHLSQATGRLATVTGRYYAMDRDTRWDRISKAWHALVKGEGKMTQDIPAAVSESYNEGITDEFLKPVIRTDADGNPLAMIRDGDVVIFTNFRGDRARQLTRALSQEDFPDYGMHKLDLEFLTFKAYDQRFSNIDVMFGDAKTDVVLGEVLERAGKRQLRIAETEKYAHVTYFFNNGREDPFKGEDRIVVPSPRDVANYDEKPQMSAFEITDKLLDYLPQNQPDFVCLNFANADMVGHTGNFDAAVKACETVDSCLDRIMRPALEMGYDLFITADHGNADVMVNPDGSPNTNHSTNPVPLIFVSKKGGFQLSDGKLSDIAPTMLKLMDLEIPEGMSGDVLLKNTHGKS